jgi:hypothetical protein
MRARRLVDRKNFAVSFLPTHLAIGASIHTVTVPTPVRDRRGARIPGKRIRFIHVHVPFFFVTLSWQIPV